MTLRLPISLLLALFVCAASAVPAAATVNGDFTVTLKRPPAVATDAGDARYEFADETTSTTMLLMRGATELARGATIAGNSSVTAASAALQPGDRVEIYKPSIPAGPPVVSPVDSYVIPNLSVSGSAGATSVSGAAPDGALARVEAEPACDFNTEQSLPVVPVGGAFSSPSGPLAAGVGLTLYVFSGTGDYTAYRTAVPGETPCFSAYAYPSPEQPSIDPQAATPFGVRVGNLKISAAIDSRLVWRRGAATLGDTTNVGDSQFGLVSAIQPLPGDVLEVYRPQTAVTPSRTVTIPNVSATVDSAASLVAVDSPFASGLVDIFAADPGPSSHASRRSFLSLAPGRTLVDFNLPQSDQRAFKMNPGGITIVSWHSLDWGVEYGFSATPGDLVAPVISAKLKSKLRLSKIKKSIAMTIGSNEPATGTATILIPKKLPGKGHPKTKAGKRTIKFATAKLSLRAGSNRVRIKLSKAGKKALKQLRGAGKKMRPVKAIVRITIADPSNNSISTDRSFKLVVK